jgi:hypothetical protein
MKLGETRPSTPDEPPFFTLGVFRPGEYPARRLRRLKVKTALPRRAPKKRIGVHWDAFDEFLARHFSMGWTAGTILALRAKGGQVFLLLVKAVMWTPFHRLEALIYVLDWKKGRLPSSSEVRALKARSSHKYPGTAMSVVLGTPSAPERLSVVGWREVPEGGLTGGVSLAWDHFEELLVANSRVL